ncbi:hypothetical protein ACH4M4_35445 [Streptomyces sp. NPDC017254]|uniref:hypothetical protein n=1 Tax=unclassified Streptomyces TaxID=2593676 RepID=UPI003787BAC7
MSQPGVFVGPITEGRPALGACAAAVAFVTAGVVHLLLVRTSRTGGPVSSTPTPEEITA